jgi:hypothetical protein
MKTLKQVLEPYLIPNEEYGGYDIASLDAERAMKIYANEVLREKTAALRHELSEANKVIEGMKEELSDLQKMYEHACNAAGEQEQRAREAESECRNMARDRSDY